MDETDYTDKLVAGCELLWGEGFLSPGGDQEVALIVNGLNLKDKTILDIGSGIGGPTICLATKHGASRVVGVDLEPLNVERATRKSTKAGLAHRVTFKAVEGGGLPFDDGSFDIVFSKDAIIEAPNKADLMCEAYRVLRSNGRIALSDWFRGSEPYTAEMTQFLKDAGPTLRMATLDETATLLRDAGFVEITVSDRNAWYQIQSKKELERMAGEDRCRFKAVLGKDETEKWIATVKSKCAAVEQGQLRPGHLQALRP
jgi:phosphoethanolamine N-methyltransferase